MPKKNKQLSRESHEQLARELLTIQAFLHARLLDCGMLYGVSHKIPCKIGKTIQHLKDVKSMLDSRFFIDHPECEVAETPYYGRRFKFEDEPKPLSETKDMY
jgi:hypothetical protein